MTISRLTTTTALTRAWGNLTHGLRFESPSIWLMLLDPAHRPVQPVIELEEADAPPRPEDQGLLLDFLTELAALTPARECRLAVLRSRPGRGLPDSTDRAWGTAVRQAAAGAGVPCLAVHFANDEHLVALPVPVAGPPHQRRRGA